MTLRIIDNKRVELTNDEWKTYQEICSSYDKPNFQGKDLFKDIFETNQTQFSSFLSLTLTY